MTAMPLPAAPGLMAAPLSAAALPTHEERAARTAELLARRADSRSERERQLLTAEIVHVNRGVATAMALRYRDRGVPTDDLVQTAFVGLTKAVVRFDPALADDLLTFAVPTIRGQLQRHFRDQVWSVRPPRRVQELHHRVRLRSEELCQQLGREPALVELARELGESVGDVQEALAVQDVCFALSLDQPSGADSSAPLGDLLPSGECATDLVDDLVALDRAVRRLTERERHLLYLRYFEDRTQAEIGSLLGVSQMQVSRLLTRLLRRVRDEIA